MVVDRIKIEVAREIKYEKKMRVNREQATTQLTILYAHSLAGPSSHPAKVSCLSAVCTLLQHISLRRLV